MSQARQQKPQKNSNQVSKPYMNSYTQDKSNNGNCIPNDQNQFVAFDPRLLDKNLMTAEGKSQPTEIKCQFCQKFGVTIVKNKIGKGTLCASFLICIFFFPLFFLPFCFCLDKVHYCQICGQIVGSRLFEIC